MSDTISRGSPARERLLTTEEAALRHVSLLVARGAPMPEIFAAAAEQVARIFGRPWVGVMRYDSPESFVVLATWGEHPFPVGSRWPLDGPSTFEAVLRTGRPAAVSDYTGLPGTVAGSARQAGIVGGFGAPIVVDGATWGVIAVPVTRGAGIPEGAETRLTVFTELLATAISNAETRDARDRLAAEQAALRGIATLVARESAPVEVFAAVCAEARGILGSEAAGLLRFEAGGTATLVAQSETPWDPPPLGTSFTLDGENIVTQVFHTAEAARADDWTDSTGAVAAMATVLGVRSAIAAPVIVEGRLWGTIVAASSQDEPLPGETERRIGPFTELIATAIANAEARDARAHLVEEQAALSRVATLVAQHPSPDHIYAAVAEEVALLLAAHRCAIGRYEPDETLTVTGYWSMDATDLPVGTRIPLEGDVVTASVRQSGRPIRIDTFDDLSGPLVDHAREVGPLPPSTVGAPIVVDGQAWGIIFVSSMTDPLPGDAESRVVLFTELVATAIANAESRSALRDLVEEQAALRRVATLVAQQPSPEEIFEVVSVEVARVFGFDADPASPDLAGVVRFEPGPALVPVGASKLGEAVRLGVRFPTDGLYVSSHVLRTGRSARVGADDLDSVGGATADWLRDHGLLSQVGSPIVVDGRLWGAMTVNSANDFPADTEERLERFTELLATAIANAESYDALARLADEQAALRRVATLVATGAGPEQVFAAVAEEVGRLLPVVSTTMARFEPGPALTTLAAWSGTGPPAPVNKRWPLTPINVGWKVLHTGEAARTDDYSAATDPLSVSLRQAGVKSVVGSPIAVEGRLWGVVTVRSNEGPLPPGTEERLSSFTELVATAIANVEARDALERVAVEQAALRRVATLVAVEASQEDIFAAVAEGVAGALGEELRLVRFEGDVAVVVATSEGPHSDVLPVGLRLPVGGDNALSRVFRTGAPTRIDDYETATGAIAEAVRPTGLRSIVATPVVVEGRTWGAMVVGTFGEKPVPPGTEDRLAQFAELMATDIANTEARAELVASRARIVAAGDEARRRIERNLHDGTQQRLIALGLDLQRARAAIPTSLSDTHLALAAVEQDLEAVLGDLRELSHGLHPPLLSRLGLGPSLEALARRSPIPVQVDIQLRERPAEPLETAVYYVVSEALTNAIKHSRASEIVVTIRSTLAYLHATVVDDGLGGANPSGGSGLTGLVDRVAALGGRFACESPPSSGTRISVDLPVGPAA